MFVCFLAEFSTRPDPPKDVTAEFNIPKGYAEFQFAPPDTDFDNYVLSYHTADKLTGDNYVWKKEVIDKEETSIKIDVDWEQSSFGYGFVTSKDKVYSKPAKIEVSWVVE